jgi:pimeloyl-ACP methyl ester carboxylesterase
VTRASILVAPVLTVWLSACVCARLYETPWPEPVETHQVRTADGWVLDVRHVRPSGGARAARPVVLMHGVVTNGRNCDLDAQHSLARDLAGRGFDVWVPSLRGTGPSEHRRLVASAAGEADFDTVVEQDVPAVIEHVRKATGADGVDWVGHSMGGMLVYAHLARGGGGVGRVVTLGSPVRLRLGGRIESLVRAASPAAGLAPWVPLAAVTRATLPLQGAVDGPVERLLVGRENVTPETWRRFLAVGVDDVPAGLARQFAGWVERDRFDSRDGKVDYLAGLSRVRVPVLVVAGKVDGIAPPWAVRPAYDALGSEEKRWLLLSEANGVAADYNHMDMLLGERASLELWGRVAAFLRAAP